LLGGIIPLSMGIGLLTHFLIVRFDAKSQSINDKSRLTEKKND